jgi:hypothetical protein
MTSPMTFRNVGIKIVLFSKRIEWITINIIKFIFEFYLILALNGRESLDELYKASLLLSGFESHHIIVGCQEQTSYPLMCIVLRPPEDVGKIFRLITL